MCIAGQKVLAGVDDMLCRMGDRSPLYSSSRAARRDACLALAFFAGLTLLVFHPVLLTSSTDRVVSFVGGDLVPEFLPLRRFGFDQLRRGHVPLWNPYAYGGLPFEGGFQSALFYPLNWLHLLLPVATAINWIVALHVLLSGGTMYLWVRCRGNSAAAGVLAGVMFMFSGPLILRVYAGHLSHLGVMPWVPLLMLSIDRLADTGRGRWAMLGAAAVALAILAGSPQYVYYAGLIGGAYTLLRCVRSNHKRQLVAGFAIIFIAGVALAAVQLLPGLEAARESVRSGGARYDFASEFALPPENLLTLVVPDLFGRVHGDALVNPVGYFGRNYPWESSLYVGWVGLTLAGVTAVVRFRRQRELLLMITLALLLALGQHVPVYRLLYRYVPLYGSFRGVAKFGFFIAMFLCPLAAEGLDLLKSGTHRRAAGRAALIAGGGFLLLVLVALKLQLPGDGSTSPWASWLGHLSTLPETNLSPAQSIDPVFVRQSAANAMTAAAQAAAVLAVAAAALAASRWWPRAAIALVGLAVIESTAFARSSFATTSANPAFPAAWLAAARRAPADARVINLGFSDGIIGTLNQGAVLGVHNLWGYDPGVLKRYAEVLFVSQGGPADEAGQYLPISRDTGGIFQMLRCGVELRGEPVSAPGGEPDRATARMLPNPLPVAQLVPTYTIATQRDAAIARLMSPAFDPRKMVVLEAKPGIEPDKEATAGPAEATLLSTDAIEVRAAVKRPTLLVVTNNYSTGWHATATGPNPPQLSYDIQPADRTLMAIPLAAGVHDIRLEYRPPGYRVGKAMSVVSIIAYAGCGLLMYKRRSATFAGTAN